ncbi:Tp3 [Theileria parva strain Muguga]|uniref:CD8+ T cell target antigen Tp3 n=3 Tax=Theileria parva TaxID=5875 RepID=Q4N7F2_THEPA|nr:Tp3 [Theileria parva strain Muguga]EAN34106.1 Tp3 [Theileria parva strain Muguga]|eukprot:XP_766389.1 hypothetical protein [Theileria parva strain Muguga]
MKLNTIAIAFLYSCFSQFLKNVSALRRSSPDLSPDGSFLQVKSASPQDKQDVIQSSSPKVTVPTVDPEGLKKAVTAAVLSNQNQALQNGALNPADFTQAASVNSMSNAVSAMNNTVGPVKNPMATVGTMNSFTGMPGVQDNFPQTPPVNVQDTSTQENSLDNLNLLLDPSLVKISQADSHIKESMEKAVHSLKKVLEGLTNLATLSKSRDTEPFNVLGDDYTMRNVLDLMNKELRQVESLQKVVFQFNAFALSTFTKSPDDNKKS